MNETRKLVEDSAAKLLAPFAEPAVQRRMEADGKLDDVWQAIAASGLGRLFADSDDPWRDAATVLMASGRHIVPAPLAETIIAGAALMLSGLDQRECFTSLAVSEHLDVQVGSVSGELRRVPWGAHVDQIVVSAGDRLLLLPTAGARKVKDRSISREPRDTLVFDRTGPIADAPVPWLLLALGALMRAAEIAGCIEAVLQMTVQYAQQRSQFGKPIGSFQAVQHQLAIMAGAAAASRRAVEAAFDRIAARMADPEVILFEAAVSKARTSEAAAQVASIAHQAHGAMGFTDEHALHYYTRRLWTWRTEFGSEGYWARHLGQMIASASANELWPSVTRAS